jgi:MFS transporter, UMF1 family
VQLSFLAVAVWWLGFSVPLFWYVAEPPLPHAPTTPPSMNDVQATLTQLRATLKTLRTYKHAALFLLAFLLYNDGISTIIRMAVVSGIEIGIPQRALLTAILLVQLLAFPVLFFEVLT